MTQIFSPDDLAAIVGNLVQAAIYAPLALALFLIARTKGLFQLSDRSRTPTEAAVPRTMHLVTGFCIYLFGQLLIGRMVATVYVYWTQGVLDPKWLDQEAFSWIALVSLTGGGLATVTYTIVVERGGLRSLWLADGKSVLKGMVIGCGACCVAYPSVMVVAHLVGAVVTAVAGYSELEQVAVQHFRNTVTSTVLMAATAFVIAVVVPVVEECVFRLLLQSYIRRFLAFNPAVIFTSLMFSLFHYSPEQGVNNIGLLITLFCLSCFLGRLYEQQRSLWAPIALHIVFNGVGILLILIFG